MTKEEQALWDHINSLTPELKAKAIEFQRGLEAEAAKTEGGMMKVIEMRMRHNTMLLEDALDEVQEISALEQTGQAIRKWRL